MENHENVTAVVIACLIAMAGEALVVYFFIKNVGDLFTDASEYPVFDAGMSAKGFITVGMNARGIVCLSMMGEGIITISMLGYGIVFFVGQVGATLRFGLYQLGVAW